MHSSIIRNLLAPRIGTGVSPVRFKSDPPKITVETSVPLHWLRLARVVLVIGILPMPNVLATDVSGTLDSNTQWSMAGNPYIVTSSLTVAANATLTIDPGVTVQFADGTGMTVQGRLLAEGTSNNRIQFTRAAGASSWTRFDFAASPSESRITFADIAYPGGSGTVRGSGTSLYLENVLWTNTTSHLIELTDCSFTLLNSVLPDMDGHELITAHGTPASGHAIIKGNTFGSDGHGVNDIIDWTGGQRPGAILQVYDNVFLAGTDDGLDLDGTDAHIEGNIFMHFHADNGIGAPDTCSGISGGRDGGRTSRITIARNLFYDCDRGILCKEGNFYVLQNNTFVNMAVSGVNFDEPLRGGIAPGAGVIFEGNIVWNTPMNFENVTTNSILANNNIFSATDYTNTGVGNLLIDPLLTGTNGVTAENIREKFALLPTSPAIGTGPNGLDCGALVPAGAWVSGEPIGVTTNDSALLTVFGPGITAYKWRINGGPWSEVVSLTNSFNYATNLFANAAPITLSNLTDGAQTVEVLGVNSAGVLQDTNTPTVSKTWIVQSDTDGDGLPDAWERENGTNPNLNDASSDPDLDGLSNLQEFWAGTSPTNAASVLRLNAIIASASELMLSFEAISNRGYTIESRTSAGDAWTNFVEWAPVSTNHFVTVTNSPLSKESLFFRLLAHP